MCESFDFRYIAERIKNSDEKAFQIFFNSFYEYVVRYIQFRIGINEVAEDIAQELFYKIWKNRTSINTELSFKAYVYTITNNLINDYFREQKNTISMDTMEDEILHASTPYSIYEKNELKQMILDCASELSEKTKIVFLMSRIEDLSYKEIAERLNISIKTIEVHIGKALKAIRNCINNKM